MSKSWTVIWDLTPVETNSPKKAAQEAMNLMEQEFNDTGRLRFRVVSSAGEEHVVDVFGDGEAQEVP